MQNATKVTNRAAARARCFLVAHFFSSQKLCFPNSPASRTASLTCPMRSRFSRSSSRQRILVFIPRAAVQRSITSRAIRLRRFFAGASSPFRATTYRNAPNLASLGLIFLRLANQHQKTFRTPLPSAHCDLSAQRVARRAVGGFWLQREKCLPRRPVPRVEQRVRFHPEFSLRGLAASLLFKGYSDHQGKSSRFAAMANK